MNIYNEVERILRNTEYAVLHGWQSLPDHHHSDLDITINPHDLYVLEKSLVDFKSAKLVQMLQHESSCFYFILARKNGNGTEFLQVDAATDYRRNGLTYFSAEQLNSERQKWKGFWVTSPRVEFAYLLVKKTLKRETPEHQKTRLGILINEIGEKGSVEIATELFGEELGSALIGWISQNNWDEHESNVPKLRRALIIRVVRNDPLNPLKYWLNDTRRILGRWLRATGLFVAVLGPDGAGKSTLIENLKHDLLGAFRRTENYHLRPAVLGKTPGDGPVTNPHGKPARSFLLSTLKVLYYAADYSLGYAFRLYPKLVKSTMVIFDRYYDDLLIDPVRYRYGGSEWLARLGSNIVPSPELFFVLDTSEAELLSRKQEVEIEELARQRRAYLDMAAGLSNAYILDASVSPAKLADHASEIITDYLHGRYMKRRRAYFPDNDRHNTIEWLISALSADPQKYYFSLEKNGTKKGSLDLKTHYKFNYLPVKDQRGYLLPQNRITAANGLNLYNAQTKKAKALKALISASYQCGLDGLLMKSVSVLSSGDMKTEGNKDLLVFEYLSKQLNLKDPDFAISLGTPGPDRKPVIQINTKEGLVVGYAKAGWNEATNALVKNEADTIENLSQVSFKTFDTPEVLHAGVWHGRNVTVLSAPDGSLLSSPKNLEPGYIDVVNELSDFNPVRMPLRESHFWAGFTGRVNRIKSEYCRSILEQKAIPLIENTLGDVEIPFHVSHGDFAPWNTFNTDGGLFIYDWEHSRPDTPAGWDLFHFIFQTNVFLENKGVNELYGLIFSESRSPLTIQYWKKLGIDGDTARNLFLLYVFEKLSLEASGQVKNFESLNRLWKLVYLAIKGRAAKF